MPIMRRLKTLDWPTLVAELVLIFVGITAALWFDSLNESRADRRLETDVLTELGVALESDTLDLNFNLRSSARTLAAIDTVLTYLDQRRPYESTLADHFRQASIHTGFLHNSAAYEFLKSVGLNIISNDSLRVAITHYYEYEVQYLRAVEQGFVSRNWNDAMRPQMMEKFSFQFLFQPAVPNDYSALFDDGEYQTVLRTTRGVLGWKDGRTRSVLESAEGLLEGIRAELVPR